MSCKPKVESCLIFWSHDKFAVNIVKSEQRILTPAFIEMDSLLAQFTQQVHRKPDYLARYE